MALDSLAEPADLPEPWDMNLDAVQALSVASAAIRDAAGAAISQLVDVTLTVTGAGSRLLRLPTPIIAVTGVSDMQGTLVEGRDYQVIPEGLWRLNGCWADRHGNPVAVAVSGTFGAAEIPADIVDLCAQLAVAWMQHRQTGGGSIAGLASVKIDDAAESYTAEASGQVSPAFIPQVTRDWLAARFGAGSAVVVETL